MPAPGFKRSLDLPPHRELHKVCASLLLPCAGYQAHTAGNTGRDRRWSKSKIASPGHQTLHWAKNTQKWKYHSSYSEFSPARKKQMCRRQKAVPLDSSNPTKYRLCVKYCSEHKHFPGRVSTRVPRSSHSSVKDSDRLMGWWELLW